MESTGASVKYVSPSAKVVAMNSKYSILSGSEPRINPCVISFIDAGGNPIEVECEISFDEATGQHYIQRTTDGEAIAVPSLAIVTSYGARYLDLRSYGNANADRLLIESGTYNSLDQKRDADKTLLEQGEWPAAWYRDFETDVHPSTYGYHAYAIMVYEKMRELGYLDE